MGVELFDADFDHPVTSEQLVATYDAIFTPIDEVSYVDVDLEFDPDDYPLE